MKQKDYSEKDNKNQALPEGLGFSLALSQDAMKNFSNMTDEQKRAVITESKLAQSKDEMGQLVDRIASNSFQ